jgi:small GTP-binding protein
MADSEITQDALEPLASSDDPVLLAMLDELDSQSADDDLPAALDPGAGGDVVAQARESLESTIAALKLTPDEERAMAHELSQLRDLSKKLDETTVEIAAFGMVSRGKSSVLNALLGKDVFKTGRTHGTTMLRGEQRWEQVAAERPGLDGAKLVLIDTPGIDEVGGEGREALARDVARHADLILFVVSSDMQRVEVESLSTLRDAQKPIILVFNQIDKYPEADRDQIHAKIKDERVRHLVRPEDVVMTAAKPDPFRVKLQLPDGTTSFRWEHPTPVIEPLRARILDVLEREGKALVALNTLLIAGDLHAEIVAHKVRIRDDAANRLIWNFCLAKGAAVGLNPVPVADLAGGLAVDVAMIVALSRVYGIPLTKKTAAGLVRQMMVALGAMGAIEIATRLIASGVKSSLAGLTVLSGGLAFLGYGAVGLAIGSSAATTTYVIGQGAKIYLQQGCQWGPRGIKTVIHQILSQAKSDSVVDRLRADLKSRLGG